MIPGNYLCPSCAERATDALGWPVSIVTEADDAGLPTVVFAVHEDWTRCEDVGTRRRAYVDDVAFLVLPGELGESYLQPLAAAEAPGSETLPGPDDTEKCWELVHEALAEDVRWLKDDDFLLLEYTTGDPDYTVYGQLTPRAGGYHLEVVSNQYLPADDWPLDAGYLQQAGWTPPNDGEPNWHRFQRGPDQAADALLAGLRYGRNCSNPLELGWESATFPLADGE